MTNKILAAVLVAASATLAAPAFAAGCNAGVASPVQSNQQPLTRAEVRAQLVAIEKAGYNPRLGNDTNYPGDAQAAEARVAAQEASGYGTGTQGTSECGGGQ